MKHLLRVLLLGLGLLSVSLATSATEAEYAYPYHDPYVATVLGTPPELRLHVHAPDDLSVLRIQPFPKARVSSIFWQGGALRIEFARQKHTAPLVFLIGGTGNTFQSSTLQALRNLYYSAGFHVMSLSSPTTPEFISAASSSMRPGIPAEDALDLHAVMKQALAEADDDDLRTGKHGYYLVGYSIGALQAAYIAQLDRQLHAFDFRRILLINPPVNLFDSASRLDALVAEKIPGGISQAGGFLAQLLGKYAPFFQKQGGADFDVQFLYALQREVPLSEDQLAALVGLVFRLAGANIAFSSDVMTHGGRIVPADEHLTGGDTMTGYFKRSLHWTFRDYFDRTLWPYWHASHPDGSQQDLIGGMSLRAIADALRTDERIGVIVNRDDPVLGNGDVEFLQATFGDRCTVYPHGGHGGNIEYSDNQQRMLLYLDAAPER